MFDQEDLKTELLKVQVTTAGDARGPVSLLEQILDILQQSNQVQTRIGLLILCSTWVHHSTPAVKTSLETHGVIPFLTGQIGSNEHDEMERLSQGLCAFLLGLLIIGNDNSVPNFSQDELMQLIEKRIGILLNFLSTFNSPKEIRKKIVKSCLQYRTPFILTSFFHRKNI